tara:strand:- start:29 stop:658 length:630 start_codon:yes stop_codon:yes gene_type:complete
MRTVGKVRVEGIDEINAALRSMTGRARQNIERKAARAVMNDMKRKVQRAWRTATVSDPTKPVARSIRRHAAKSVSVKVGTRGTGGRKGWVQGQSAGHTSHYTYARLFHNYHKKNASRAKLAHLLEWGHATGGDPKKSAGYKAGGVDTAARARRMMTSTKSNRGWSPGKRIVTGTYNAHHNEVADRYMKMIQAWIHTPKMTQKQARSILF